MLNAEPREAAGRTQAVMMEMRKLDIGAQAAALRSI